MPDAAALAAELVRPDKLTACLSVVGAPAAALDEDGQLVGYNVDFAKEIAMRLSLPLASREPLFDTLIDLVSGHECDLSVSSQNITAGRLQLVDFIAYTKSIQPVLVAEGNPLGIDSLDDLCGQPVSATAGTTHVDLVTGSGDYVGQGIDDQCAAESRPPVDLRTFETESHAATSLLSGDVVAYLGNPNFAFDFADQIDYSDATLPPARQGIAVARNRPAVFGAVAVTLNEMMADGTYREILARHLPNDESVDAVSVE